MKQNIVTFVERPLQMVCNHFAAQSNRIMSDILSGKVPEGENLVVILDNGRTFKEQPKSLKNEYHQE